MQKLIIMPVVCIGFLLVFSGCASLQDYTRKTAPARSDIETGNFEGALAMFPETEAQGNDEVLIRLERAKILQDSGRFAQSSAEFEKAAEKNREFEDKAVISASDTVSEIGTLLINEQVRPYEGEDFEIILMHSLNAINYLMNKDIEGARVEIRRSYERQEQLSEKHEKELRKAQEDNASKYWERSFDQADKNRYENLRQKASSVYSVYKNAFASYISSFVYELGSEMDDAYIDLKKAYQAYPSNRFIQKDLIRISARIGFKEDQEKWESQFGKITKIPKDAIDVFVVYCYGEAPYKVPLKFPIPTRHGFVFASIPVYQFSPASIYGAAISSDGIDEDASTLFDVDAVAARNFLDDFPIIFAKQIARSYIKAKATDRLAHQQGGIGAILGTLFSAITEQADLRVWSSLPKQIQVARVFLPKSASEINIKSLPMGRYSTIQIPKGTKHMIVYCRAFENGLATYTKSF